MVLENLHKNFEFSRPLTVTGAYQLPDGRIIFHQMVLDRIDKHEFILQNTNLLMDAPVLRIKTSDPYYVTDSKLSDHFILNRQQGKLSFNSGNISLDLVNEKYCDMKQQKWYLLPEAYSLSLSLV